MRYLIALLVLIPPVLLVVGTLRGRVDVRPCCVPAERDLRMAPAYAEETDAATPTPTPTPLRAGHAPG